MAYRTSDPTELELRERRTHIRREQDELQERADRLAAEIADASRGGIIGGITNLIGGKTDDELARARLDHGALETQLAALVQAERDVDAQLAQIEATRTGLAAQEATRIEAARAAPGPLGEQLRAIGAERAIVNDRLGAFDAVLADARRAATVVDDLGVIETDTSAATSPEVTVAKGMHNIAAVLTLGSPHTGDRAVLASRRASHVELACTTIQKFLESFAHLAHAWSDPKPIELDTRQLASFTPQTFDVANAHTCLDRLERTIVGDRDALAQTLAQLDARERELVRSA